MRGSGVEPPAFLLESEPLALAFHAAREAHAGQTRGGGRPYLEHAVEVARLLHEHGAGRSAVLAGLLHDVVEDSGLSIGDVVEGFGIAVGALVAALTDDPEIEDWERRKEALGRQVAAAGPTAALIYAADKLASLDDWRPVHAELGERAAERFKAPTLDARLQAWRADLEIAERLCGGHPLVARLREELAAFESQRAHRRDPAAESVPGVR